MLYVSARKFKVPEFDAESLVQEVVLAFLTTGVAIDDPKAWLIAATCNASRAYWRFRARTGCFDAGSKILESVTLNVEQIERELVVRKLLRRLPSREREILRMHYFEQLTAPEIGRRLGTTPGYAARLISKALRRARDAYQSLETEK